LKNTIVHNNDMTFIPKTGSTYSLGNAGAVTNYAAANSQSDSVINCTIAKNKGTKTGCAGLKIGIQYNNYQYPYVKIFNNICYDNAVDGSIGTTGNLTFSSGPQTFIAGGIQVANNYANGGATQIVDNTTIVYGNVSDLANSNTDVTKGANFASPSTVTGYTTDASVATSKWTIGAGSYLIAKGIVTTNKYDKSNVLFAATPAVGAYEYVFNPGTGFNNSYDLKFVSIVNMGLVSNETGAIQIVTFGGQTIFSKQVQAGNRITLASGAYIIRIVTDKGTSVQKVIL